MTMTTIKKIRGKEISSGRSKIKGNEKKWGKREGNEKRMSRRKEKK